MGTHTTTLIWNESAAERERCQLQAAVCFLEGAVQSACCAAGDSGGYYIHPILLETWQRDGWPLRLGHRLKLPSDRAATIPSLEALR